MKLEIERMAVGDWGNIIAYFDLRTTDGFLIKGVRLIKGVNGMFASLPSKSEKDGKFNDIVQAPAEIRDTITKMALQKYDDESKQAFNDIPGEFDSEKTTEKIFQE
jgi:DNA-binding cell septation regulator SpoVG